MKKFKMPSFSVVLFFLIAVSIFLIGASALAPGCVDIDEALPHYDKMKPK